MNSHAHISFRKTALALSVAALFPTLSFAAVSDSINYPTSETIQIDGAIPDDKLGGIIADGKDIVINVGDSEKLTVSGTITEEQASNVYAIFVDKDATLEMNGDLAVELNTETAATAARLDGDSTFTGNVNLTVQGAGNGVIGINIQKDAVKHEMNFNGAETTITVTSNATSGTSRIINNYGHENTELNINSNKITLSLDYSKGKGNSQGIYAYQSSVNLNGDTELIVKGNNDFVYGVNTEGDLGTPNESVVNFNGTNTTIDISGRGQVWALTPSGNTAKINLTGEQITIKASTEATNDAAFGIGTQYGAQLNITNPNAHTNIIVQSGLDAFGLYNSTYGGDDSVQYGSINIVGTTIINVSGHGLVAGIANQVSEGWDVDINNEYDGIHLSGNTSMTVTASGESATAYGVLADNLTSTNSTATVDVENLNATVTGTDGATAYGAYVANSASANLTGTTSIVAVGETAYGLNLANNGQLNIAGTMTVSGDTEGIVMDSSASLNLQENTTVAASSMQSEGTTTLNNGSQLTVSGTEGATSSLGKINANKASVNLVGGTYSLATLTGTDSSVNIQSTTVRASVIDNQSTNLLITSTPEVTDALGGQSIDQLLTIENGGKDVAFYMPEGMYEGEQTGIYGEDGKVASSHVKQNTLMQSNLELASAAPLALNRIMLTDLRKRMGDIRSDEGNYGAWARYDGGRLSGSNGLENNFHSIHIGSDAKLGQWRLGAGFSYINSDVDYARGNADMDAYGLELYGMWLGESGQFVDIVARVSSADTDMQVDASKTGSMDTMAYSLSAEFGWRFALTEQFYVEPQIEAAYTYIDTDDLNIDSASYEFDTVNSLTGRAGFAAGVQFPDKIGDLYVHASVVHEFSGDAEITGGNGSKYSIDGQDTWYEYGLGATFHLTDSTYMWADLQRTSGAVLDEDWRANVGVRYSF